MYFFFFNTQSKQNFVCSMDPDFRLWVWHFSVTELFPYSFYQKWESGPQKQRSNISVLLSLS